jgi:chaperone BCS1
MEAACVAAGSCAFPGFGAVARAVQIISSLWEHVQRQLANDFIGGSLALATASFVTNLLWKLTGHAKRIAHDRVFTTYDIPAGTPQYHAALLWLHAQPVVRRSSRRLVVNPAGGASQVAKNTPSGANDPDDPLELGLRTLPLLTQTQSVCVRVGYALVWCGHGHVGSPATSVGVSAGFDQSSLGAMGGGGSRGSWYNQLLEGARGHAGLAASASGGIPDDDSSSLGNTSIFDDGTGGLGYHAIESLDGTHGGKTLRLRVLSRNPRSAVRSVLEFGKRLGKGTARRHTQVYMPSTAMSHSAAAFKAQRGGGGFGGASGDDGGSSYDAPYGTKFASPRAEWMDAGRKPSRPASSVVLKGNACETIVEDARNFLRLERWYAERGIPYRRGYLLHGAPGSGKTSLVRAVAGELRLPVYQLPLQGPGVDDETFHRLLNATARRSVVLLEDVDAAGTGSVHSAFITKKTDSKDVAGSKPDRGENNATGFGFGPTLPGLLAALDGVGAAEGRLLFMTCRDLAVLEPALIRPGRIDLKLEFSKPDTAQAAALFLHFYKERRSGVTNTVTDATSQLQKDSQTEIRENIDALARAFAEAVTDDSKTSNSHPVGHSMAALQGHLMLHREDPVGAVKAVARDASRKGNGVVVGRPVAA